MCFFENCKNISKCSYTRKKVLKEIRRVREGARERKREREKERESERRRE